MNLTIDNTHRNYYSKPLKAKTDNAVSYNNTDLTFKAAKMKFNNPKALNKVGKIGAGLLAFLSSIFAKVFSAKSAKDENINSSEKIVNKDKLNSVEKTMRKQAKDIEKAQEYYNEANAILNKYTQLLDKVRVSKEEFALRAKIKDNDVTYVFKGLSGDYIECAESDDYWYKPQDVQSAVDFCGNFTLVHKKGKFNAEYYPKENIVRIISPLFSNAKVITLNCADNSVISVDECYYNNGIITEDENHVYSPTGKILEDKKNRGFEQMFDCTYLPGGAYYYNHGSEKLLRYETYTTKDVINGSIHTIYDKKTNNILLTFNEDEIKETKTKALQKVQELINNINNKINSDPHKYPEVLETGSTTSVKLSEGCFRTRIKRSNGVENVIYFFDDKNKGRLIVTADRMFSSNDDMKSNCIDVKITSIEGSVDDKFVSATSKYFATEIGDNIVFFDPDNFAVLNIKDEYLTRLSKQENRIKTHQ